MVSADLRLKLKSAKWEVRQRLEFIELRLFWDGKLNRSDLADSFGVSIIQASKDFRQYMEIAPENMQYDKRGKHYVRAEEFSPVLTMPSAEEYLTGLLNPGGWGRWRLAEAPQMSFSVDAIRPPHRKIETCVLQVVLAAMNEKGDLRILYQSMGRSEPVWRWIYPHAFNFDGHRWHCRAFCHMDSIFKDFLLSRIVSTGEQRLSSIEACADADWNERIEIVIAPHHGLSSNQKEVIESDYGMTEGSLAVSVRKALVFYYLKMMRIEEDGTGGGTPEQQQIIRVYPGPDGHSVDI